MTVPYSEMVKDQLVLWLAAGGTLEAWSRRNAIPLRTASRWSQAKEFRRKVAAIRRRQADRAIGEMARHFGKAAAMAGRLVDRGKDDRVRLAAASALIDHMLDIGGRRELAARIRRLERRLAAQGDGR